MGLDEFAIDPIHAVVSAQGKNVNDYGSGTTSWQNNKYNRKKADFKSTSGTLRVKKEEFQRILAEEIDRFVEKNYSQVKDHSDYDLESILNELHYTSANAAAISKYARENSYLAVLSTYLASFPSFAKVKELKVDEIKLFFRTLENFYDSYDNIFSSTLKETSSWYRDIFKYLNEIKELSFSNKILVFDTSGLMHILNTYSRSDQESKVDSRGEWSQERFKFMLDLFSNLIDFDSMIIIPSYVRDELLSKYSNSLLKRLFSSLTCDANYVRLDESFPNEKIKSWLKRLYESSMKDNNRRISETDLQVMYQAINYTKDFGDDRKIFVLSGDSDIITTLDKYKFQNINKLRYNKKLEDRKLGDFIDSMYVLRTKENMNLFSLYEFFVPGLLYFSVINKLLSLTYGNLGYLKYDASQVRYLHKLDYLG